MQMDWPDIDSKQLAKLSYYSFPSSKRACRYPEQSEASNLGGDPVQIRVDHWIFAIDPYQKTILSYRPADDGVESTS
ncbi:hypothetical protein [Alicyclobacillus acidiphilus]|uniref:hypothetical protein n=1 Tax=Alicyclobacillus acidiphilus TaxID=182455 RepID=UPI00082A68E9|nr:hypothetical protein [Alicyclobacillus acidiphilus]